jgi:hypothetical protein
MLASAKSKAHKAFKNVNYLVATKNYDEVCFCLLFVEVRTVHESLRTYDAFSPVCYFPSRNVADVVMLCRG